MSNFVATDWNVVGVESVGPRRARKEAAALNGPTGNGFPRIGKPSTCGPTKRENKVQALNVAAINLPRVAAPLASIRPHFTTDARTFRSARATPPASGSGIKTFVVVAGRPMPVK